MTNINEGLQSWQLRSNHNRMLDFQANESTPVGGEVKIEHFAGSAFRLTTPAGITVMIDPWRNLATRRWDWYFFDFPRTAVDIGVSTHAHFDHDALHRLDASVLLDRLIGRYEFADVSITGIADKHATDSSAATYDFRKIIEHFSDISIVPPDNPRSWDNCLVIFEIAGLRILHWGDNRADPPEDIWQKLGNIDIALLPVDESQHVLGFAAIQSIIDRLQPRVVIPHHYYIWDVVARSSTLLSAEPWVLRQTSHRLLPQPWALYSKSTLPDDGTRIDFFGDNVAFDKKHWHDTKGEMS